MKSIEDVLICRVNVMLSRSILEKVDLYKGARKRADYIRDAVELCVRVDSETEEYKKGRQYENKTH